VVCRADKKTVETTVHSSVVAQERDILGFFEAYHNNPKPYKWTNKADEILCFGQTVLLRSRRNYI